MVMKMVRAIRKGHMKIKSDEENENKEPEAYDLWKDTDEEIKKERLVHIPAPKTALPGHEESYNPPAEYLPTEEEIREWEELDPEDRPLNFLPQKFSNLRSVPGYSNFVQERFARCLDLYLCPRKIKNRIRVDPESLIPKLPKPEELQPFPTRQSIVFEGHVGRVVSVSPSPSGQWLVTAGEDRTVRFWDVHTGRCLRVLKMDDDISVTTWCPNKAISVVAIAFGTTVWLVNPGLGADQICTGTDEILTRKAVAEDSRGVVTWDSPSNDQRSVGVRFELKHPKPVNQIAWHHKGNYFASVMPEGVSKSVFIHSLLRQHSQNPFSKKSKGVEQVAFHPSKPVFFVASKTHVRVYNLQTQILIKKLVAGTKWISSLAVHPKGDNVIIGSYDRRLCWFDLDLSVKPFKVSCERFTLWPASFILVLVLLINLALVPRL